MKVNLTPGLIDRLRTALGNEAARGGKEAAADVKEFAALVEAAHLARMEEWKIELARVCPNGPAWDAAMDRSVATILARSK